MKRFYLFGSREQSIAAVLASVAATLRVAFTEHESGFLGTYYRAADPGTPEILVQSNARDEEGYLTEEDFPDHSVLVYVNDADSATATKLEAIPGLTLLRTEQI